MKLVLSYPGAILRVYISNISKQKRMKAYYKANRGLETDLWVNTQNHCEFTVVVSIFYKGFRYRWIKHKKTTVNLQ